VERGTAMKSFPGLFFFALVVSGSARAVEINGTVHELSGDIATVVVKGDLVPVAGDEAKIFFTLPGGQDEISVATGTVTGEEAGAVKVAIKEATGEVAPGHLVRFVSSNPKAKSAAAETSPATPRPSESAVTRATGTPATQSSDEATRWFKEGVAKSNARDWKGAVAAYSKSIQLNPNQAAAYANRGNAYNQLKQPERAISDLTEALRLQPDLTAAHDARGNAYVALHQYKKAIADYDEAIRLDPKDATAYNNRGGAYLETRRYQNAIEDFTRAIELDPAYAPVFLNRASAYEMIGKKQLAKADRARAKELEAGH
jgi:lipoprotein NlpI